MQRYLVTYLVVLFSYFIIDFIWLALIAQASYQLAIGHLLRENYPTWPWILFYLLYSAVVVRLVIAPLSSQNKIRQAFFNGALFGLAAYGTYNLTNYAVIASWPLGITLKDWVWGTFITGLISALGFAFQHSQLLAKIK
jgi:uncharacterized membrane protein